MAQIGTVTYVKGPDGFAAPRIGVYPGESQDKVTLPEGIRQTWNKLNSQIETKYSREYLKICAFYNKIFPSLKTSSWTRSAYNTQPFTMMDQERTDTGTGVSTNYLKQITDQVVSRLGTINFDIALLSDIPSLEYIIYKDEAERLLRKIVRDEHMNRMSMEVFHNAAVLGYSYVLMDPITHKLFKANDYEIGIFDAQWNKNKIKQLLYRDYSFPVTELDPYIEHCDDKLKVVLEESLHNKVTVDFKMYIDCTTHECYIHVDYQPLPPTPYPFDTVQVVPFAWDVGFTKVTSTSLFDLLYPSQRELNKVKAKIQQLIRMYKGAVPVFNRDVDLAMKTLSNGTGECLYVDSQRPVDTLVTVINPTPLDTALDAIVTSIKTEMLELAGVQSASFDMENMRSAASIVAVDQTRDTVFQAQLDGLATWQKQVCRMIVNYNAVITEDELWKTLKDAVKNAEIELKPVHVNDPLGNKGTITELPEPDYMVIQTARFVVDVLKGNKSWDDLSYIYNKTAIKQQCAQLMVKLSALDLDIPESLEQFMVNAFIDDVKNGVTMLGVL